MNNINIRHGNKNDANDIIKIINKAKESKYCSWDDLYPDIDDINDDIDNNHLFVLTINNKIIGSVSIEDYDFEDFNSPNYKYNDNIICIVRLCIDQSYQNKGYGEMLVKYIIEKSKKVAKNSVHFAIYSNNIPSLRLFNKFKFNKVDEVSFMGDKYCLGEILLK